MVPLVRAARAIAKRNFPRATEADLAEMSESFILDVRVVLQALREPSAAMITAGDDTETEYQSGLTDLKSEKVWPAMIDAALKER